MAFWRGLGWAQKKTFLSPRGKREEDSVHWVAHCAPSLGAEEDIPGYSIGNGQESALLRVLRDGPGALGPGEHSVSGEPRKLLSLSEEPMVAGGQGMRSAAPLSLGEGSSSRPGWSCAGGGGSSREWLQRVAAVGI